MNQSSLEFEDLLRQRTEIEAKIKALAATVKVDAIKQIAAIVTKHELSKADLMQALDLAAGKKKKKPEPRYKKPETGETWSGRGKAPMWISTAPDREVFAIKKEVLDDAGAWASQGRATWFERREAAYKSSSLKRNRAVWCGFFLIFERKVGNSLRKYDLFVKECWKVYSNSV